MSWVCPTSTIFQLCYLLWNSVVCGDMADNQIARFPACRHRRRCSVGATNVSAIVPMHFSFYRVHHTNSRQIRCRAAAPKKYPQSFLWKQEFPCPKELWDGVNTAQGQLPKFGGSQFEAEMTERPLENCPMSPRKWRDVLWKTAACRFGKVHFLGGGFLFLG